MEEQVTLFLVMAAPVRAATLHVDDGASAGDGSAQSPLSSLQQAIDLAEDGDEIRVAEGSYGPIEVSFKTLQLLGGYDAGFTSVSASTPSVIEGVPGAAAVTLYETGDSVVAGFVMRGGQHGIYIDAEWNSTTNKPEIRDNLIEQNGDPAFLGGGILADHCDITLRGNTIRDNIGDRGAAVAAFCTGLLVEDNVVEGNVGYGDHGGGLYMAGPDITLRGNLIRDNEIGVIMGYGWGAGALVFNEGSSAVFEGNVFTGNHAQSVGSAAFIDDGAVSTFSGDLFYDNVCGDAGGAALYVDGYYTNVSSSATLTNVTMAGHDCTAVYVEAQSTVDFLDSIVWSDGGDDFVADGTSSVTGTYTLSSEPLEGTGNLSADPLFADPSSGDFHVLSSQGRYDAESGTFVLDEVDSPTIDAGDPSSPFELEPGPNGLRVNLGHTGNTAEASMGGPGGTPPEQEEPPEEEEPPEQEDPPAGEEPGDDSPGDGKAPESEGCGCQSGPPPQMGLLGLVLWAQLSRRSRKSLSKM